MNVEFDGVLKRFYITSYKNYLIDNSYEPATINKKVNIIGALNNYLIAKGYMQENVIDLKKDRVKIAVGSEHQIENKPNEHGYLYLKCLIDDSIKFQYTINDSTNDKICVYEELEDENISSDKCPVNINEVNEKQSKILFNGIVQNVRTSNANGVYYLEIQGFTSSFELDIKEKSRSFQNINMTYNELITQILKDYSGFTFTQNVGKGQKINRPLFQYKETDWNFIKRVVSEFKAELYCDIINLNNMFYYRRRIKN